MGWTGVIVMYVVFWFIALFLILPRGQKTQIEHGEIEPGTPGGAPAEINIGRKFLYATIAAAAAPSRALNGVSSPARICAATSCCGPSGRPAIAWLKPEIS